MAMPLYLSSGYTIAVPLGGTKDCHFVVMESDIRWTCGTGEILDCHLFSSHLHLGLRSAWTGTCCRTFCLATQLSPTTRKYEELVDLPGCGPVPHDLRLPLRLGGPARSPAAARTPTSFGPRYRHAAGPSDAVLDPRLGNPTRRPCRGAEPSAPSASEIHLAPEPRLDGGLLRSYRA